MHPWFHLGFTLLLVVCWALLQQEELTNSQICLQVTDRRDVVFQKPELPGSFPGLGHVVGTSESKQVQETSEMPGKILNVPQNRSSFLRRRFFNPARAVQVWEGNVGAQHGKQHLWVSSTHRMLSASILLENETGQVIKEQKFSRFPKTYLPCAFVEGQAPSTFPTSKDVR